MLLKIEFFYQQSAFQRRLDDDDDIEVKSTLASLAHEYISTLYRKV
jgi:hypothetical protein